jgi:hypothetical protein
MIKALINKELDLLHEKAVAYGRYKQGHISYGEFIVEFMAIEEKSSFDNPKHYLMDWLIGEKNNDLPITSSGSTLNAILDEDGFINTLEGEDVDYENEILSYECKEYICDEINSIKTNIRCKLRESGSI